MPFPSNSNPRLVKLHEFESEHLRMVDSMRDFRSILLKVVCYTVIFLLTGCSMRSVSVLELHQSEPFPESAKFVNEWLEDDCPQPCWQGIVPKRTPLHEAVDILHSIPELTYVEVYPSRETKGGGFVSFDVSGGGRRLVPGRLLYDSDEIIESISYSAGDSITIQDVIDKLGTPSHFNGSAFSHDEYTTYTMEILFIKQGVRLDVSGELPEGEQQLWLDTYEGYLSVTFFEPNSQEDSSLSHAETLQEWPGFVLLDIVCVNTSCQLVPVIPQE